jgi:hypothetical protein
VWKASTLFPEALRTEFARLVTQLHSRHSGE